MFPCALLVAAFALAPFAAAVPLAAVKAASHCASAASVPDCLMRAAAAGVDALARSADPFELIPGCVTLVKHSEPPSATSVPEADAEAALVDSVAAFAESRAITVRAPVQALRSFKNSLMEDRGKKDKYSGPLLMGAMMVAGTLLPIKLGALAMMSGKALMTSMLALMLAAILALKKLASGGGGHSGATYEVINVPSHPPHVGHGRALAHGMAYGGSVGRERDDGLVTATETATAATTVSTTTASTTTAPANVP